MCIITFTASLFVSIVPQILTVSLGIGHLAGDQYLKKISYLKAFSPVMSMPVMSKWMSWVPS